MLLATTYPGYLQDSCTPRITGTAVPKIPGPKKAAPRPVGRGGSEARWGPESEPKPASEP
jgi:hypothetical protein